VATKTKTQNRIAVIEQTPNGPRCYVTIPVVIPEVAQARATAYGIAVQAKTGNPVTFTLLEDQPC
jgi:hypothetical protein